MLVKSLLGDLLNTECLIAVLILNQELWLPCFSSKFQVGAMWYEATFFLLFANFPPLLSMDSTSHSPNPHFLSTHLLIFVGEILIHLTLKSFTVHTSRKFVFSSIVSALLMTSKSIIVKVNFCPFIYLKALYRTKTAHM
ncbi:hypothetical protein AMECASPLE_019860 [Ameca splendens]|uniref:Uncharacterized protein n=1 Tax=Ameca splendens TaxID=208324 RepID=A0ABV0XSE0_9TELE